MSLLKSFFYNVIPAKAGIQCRKNRTDVLHSWTPAFAGVTMMAAALFLTACGFTPLYSSAGGASKAVIASYPLIEIGNIPDREGQYLRNCLIDRLYINGRPANAPYLLTLTPIEKTTFNMGVRKDATVTRAQIQIATRLRLTDKTTNKILLQRDLRSMGAYNLLDNQLATLTSERSAVEGMLRELTDNAVAELDLYFKRKSGA